MFTLPALLYLKLLPLFGHCLYHLIVPNKSRPPHAGGTLPSGPLPALHPFWVGRASVGIFAPRQREDVCLPTNDLTCNRHTYTMDHQRNGVSNWNPTARR
ncbi:hypothetical protein AVEN_52751-1 [Araneus ventricosus]|uniref:Secreted protein n=1 Tax=Araneus ventricosus TaxID=182803 RepID=A0A4Y2CY51_ARAVE|nr:hypothetical protein AVEN_52751-1 [Araneus ventricosus]